MKTHTPGPWKLRPNTDRGSLAILGPDGLSVASTSVAKSRAYNQSAADARLIAAAPEMLACLKMIHELICSDQENKGLDILRNMIIESVIKKAEEKE